MTVMLSPVPPNDLDLERAALGAAFFSVEDAKLIASVPPQYFFKQTHKDVQRVLSEILPSLNGTPLDATLVHNWALRLGLQVDRVALAGLLEQAAVSVHVPGYIEELARLAAQREEYAASMLITRLEQGAWSAEVWEHIERAKALRIPRFAQAKPIPVSLAQFAATPPAEPLWLIEGLILQQANGWIAAGAKVGKSYLALDLLLACALGVPWLDHFAVPRPLTVILVEEEDSPWRVYQRLIRRLCAGRGVAPPINFHLLVRSGIQLDDPATLDPFCSWLRDVRPDLVCWDVFNKLHTKNERFPDQTLPLLKRIDRIRDEIGCANLIAHHTRKPGASGPDLASGGEKLRGPSEYWAWAENSLYLTPLKGKGVIRVEPESKDALVEPFKAHLEDRADGSRQWIYDGVIEAKLDQGAKNRAALVEALHPGALSAEVLAEQLKLSVRTVKAHLAALEKDGLVVSTTEPGRARRKIWSLSESPEWVTGDM